MRSEEWRPAAAIHNRCPGRSGRPPPGTTTRSEELAVTDPAQMPVREARHRSQKSPRWSAGRRASPVWGRKAPRSGLTGASQAPDDSRRSAHPIIGVSEAAKQNPGAKNAPRERERLCRSEVLCKMERYTDRSCSQFVMRGLDPRIHLFRKKFYEAGWIAGSSPAMTACVALTSRSRRSGQRAHAASPVLV
jgi:hypothetical protein